MFTKISSLPTGISSSEKFSIDRDYQSESEVKASIQYYHKHDAADAFVAKEEGKGLSSNDFTNEFKKKLDGLIDILLDCFFRHFMPPPSFLKSQATLHWS